MMGQKGTIMKQSPIDKLNSAFNIAEDAMVVGGGIAQRKVLQWVKNAARKNN